MKHQQGGQNTMSNKKIAISEVYRNLQGEGPLLGKMTIFTRVFGCNTVCPWCDTMYAVKKQPDEDINMLEISELAEQIKALKTPDVTFTGGEPMLQRDKLDILMGILGPEYAFHFETNGIVHSPDFENHNVTFVVSPKFHSSAWATDEKKKRYTESIWNWVNTNKQDVCFKFVYEGQVTVDKIRDLESAVGGFGKRQIYLMPEGKSYSQEQYVRCSDAALENNWGMTPRMHTIIHGPKRGV